MIAIGLRVMSDKRISYTVIEQSETLTYIDINEIVIPLAVDWPEALSYVRNTLLDIFREYSISRAVIRIAEYRPGPAKKTDVQRNYIEGVIQESFASSNIDKFKACTGISIASISGYSQKQFKAYEDGESFPYYPEDEAEWDKLAKEKRGSVLACYAALKM